MGAIPGLLRGTCFMIKQSNEQEVLHRSWYTRVLHKSELFVNIKITDSSASLSHLCSHPSRFFFFLLWHSIYDFIICIRISVWAFWNKVNYQLKIKRTNETLWRLGSPTSGLPLPAGFKLTLRIPGQLLLCSGPLLSTVRGLRSHILLQRIQGLCSKEQADQD